MQVARNLVEQFLNQFVGMGDFHVMVVVDNQVELLAQHGRSFDDDGDAGFHSSHRVVFAQQVDVHLDSQPPQPFEQRGAEGGVTVVVGRQRNPGHFRAGHESVLTPLRHQGRLAVTRGTGDQRQFAVMHALELSEQGGAGHMASTDARRRKLGRDQVPGWGV
ncbi:hypothetical protein D3C71_1471730 [compost metagenome]